MAALATTSDMAARYDVETVGSLLSDDGEVVSQGAWSSNDKMQAALNTATGQVMSALGRAYRYTREDIDLFSAESRAFLTDIVCRVAFWKLWQIKPWGDNHDSLRDRVAEEYQEVIDGLNKGLYVFEFDPAQDAGLPEAAKGTTEVAATRSKLFRVEVGRGNLFPSTSLTDSR